MHENGCGQREIISRREEEKEEGEEGGREGEWVSSGFSLPSLFWSGAFLSPKKKEKNRETILLKATGRRSWNDSL